MEDANHGAVRDERRIGLTVENSREFNAVEGLAIAVQTGIFCSPDAPRNMLHVILFATTVALAGITPTMLCDEVFKASFRW